MSYENRPPYDVDMDDPTARACPECGKGMIWSDGECGHCGTVFREPESMTANDLRALLARLDVSQGAFAKLHGVTRQSVNRWATGVHPVPQWIVEKYRETDKTVRLSERLDEFRCIDYDYDENPVDDVDLIKLAGEIRALERENAELRERVAELEPRADRQRAKSQ